MATFISRPRSLVLALCALGTGFLTGCVSIPDATTMPLQQSQWSRLSGATLAVAARPMPPFADFKPTDGLHGVVDTLTAVAAGNELIRKYDIKDPATKIADALAQHLASAWQTKLLANVTIPIDGGNVEEIANAAAGKADLVLDVQTVNWCLVFATLRTDRRNVIYKVKLRLIDVRRKELIAEGYNAWKTPRHSSYEELFANNAALLRERLDEGARSAIETFLADILKAPSQTRERLNGRKR